MSAPINKRLLACASLVREGAHLADVGTDHGYLPIYLLSEGRIERAVLSDINRGPLAKAEENVREADLTTRVKLVLSDGARELDGEGITDYTICGMGGELIAEIIDKAPHLRDENINLILQPMSKPEALRAYLYSNGFSIDRELFVTDEGKHYVCILAHYSGKNANISPEEAYFGKREFYETAPTESAEAYFRTKLESLTRVIVGKRRGGESIDLEEKLVRELKIRLNLKD